MSIKYGVQMKCPTTTRDKDGKPTDPWVSVKEPRNRELALALDSAEEACEVLIRLEKVSPHIAFRLVEMRDDDPTRSV